MKKNTNVSKLFDELEEPTVERKNIRIEGNIVYLNGSDDEPITQILTIKIEPSGRYKSVLIKQKGNIIISRHQSSHQRNIDLMISTQLENMSHGKIKGNDLYFCDETNRQWILKDYPKFVSHQALTKTIQKINIKQHLDHVKMMTVGYRNYAKIAALLLTGALVLQKVVVNDTPPLPQVQIVSEQVDHVKKQELLEELQFDHQMELQMELQMKQEREQEQTRILFEQESNPNTRLVNTEKRQQENIDSNNPNYQLGSATDPKQINHIINSELGELFFYYADMYGVDPYLLMAHANQESQFDQNAGKKGGIMQIFYTGYYQTAFNYHTGSMDRVLVTEETIKNVHTNIQVGAMLMQEHLIRYAGNPYLELQAYIYGYPVMNELLDLYAARIGSTVDEVKVDYQDLGWLQEVADYSEARHGYGDPHYVSNVLRFYVGELSTYILDGEQRTVNLRTGEIVEPISTKTQLETEKTESFILFDESDLISKTSQKILTK